MPKVRKRIRSAALEARSTKHQPLGQVIQDDSDRKTYVSRHKHYKQQKSATREENDALLDSASSKRILDLSRQQTLELQAEESEQRRRQLVSQQQREIDSDHDNELEEEDQDDDYSVDDNGYVDIDTTQEDDTLSPEDQALIQKLMGGNDTTQEQQNRPTLADKILEAIAEKEQQTTTQQQPSLPPKVVQVYTEIGKLLSRYTSGKLPKAFKVIPSLSNWEEILYLTRPDRYTPQAMYAATRLFASNLNPKMAQRFYKLVLLDAVRDDIAYNKKLNYHLYMALKKSVYKPAAFFKGILFPLVDATDCTLLEAGIVSSILQRVSIPVHHSAVALHKLSQRTDYSGCGSIFIKTLLNKKYSLPRPVIQSLVEHFVRFLHCKETLPVLWHQSLLVFVQRYKTELVHNKEQLRALLKYHFHPKITPEIRRELFGAQAYQEERKAMELS